MHRKILSNLNKNELRIIIGKDAHSTYYFIGKIIDFRFYYEVI